MTKSEIDELCELAEQCLDETLETLGKRSPS
jgi:hypothetical protein